MRDDERGRRGGLGQHAIEGARNPGDERAPAFAAGGRSRVGRRIECGERLGGLRSARTSASSRPSQPPKSSSAQSASMRSVLPRSAATRAAPASARRRGDATTTSHDRPAVCRSICRHPASESGGSVRPSSLPGICVSPWRKRSISIMPPGRRFVRRQRSPSRNAAHRQVAKAAAPPRRRSPHPGAA